MQAHRSCIVAARGFTIREQQEGRMVERANAWDEEKDKKMGGEREEEGRDR